jgi:hypothetical protein
MSLARPNKEVKKEKGRELLLKNESLHPEERLTFNDIGTRLGVRSATVRIWGKEVRDEQERYQEEMAHMEVFNGVFSAYNTAFRG